MPGVGENGLKPPKHNHGQMYRAKIVPYTGPIEYGEWFATEADLRSAMQEHRRRMGTRYYCEAKMIGCPECEAEDGARGICTL